MMVLGYEQYYKMLKDGVAAERIPQMIPALMNLLDVTIPPEMKPFATKMIDAFYFPDKHDPLTSLRNALDYSK